MWEDAKGNWNAAHSIAQEIEDETGSWIHAYLHRKEGDLANAGYWYRRAKQPIAHDTLDEEWTGSCQASFAPGRPSSTTNDARVLMGEPGFDTYSTTRKSARSSFGVRSNLT